MVEKFTSVPEEVLRAAVEDINNELELTPKISPEWPRGLVYKALRLVAKLLHPKDNLKPETVELLVKIDAPVPTDVLDKYGISKEEKPSTVESTEERQVKVEITQEVEVSVSPKEEKEQKEQETEESKQEHKQEQKKEEKVDKRKKRKPYVLYLEQLVSEGKYTKAEIIQKVMEKFPEIKKQTLQTVITDCKSVKYTRFKGKVIEETEDGILFFKEIEGGKK